MIDGVIKSFEPDDDSTRTVMVDLALWYKVTLEDDDREFFLHRNWVATRGKLKPGDKVRYIVSTAVMHGHASFDKLEKVEEPDVK